MLNSIPLFQKASRDLQALLEIDPAKRKADRDVLSKWYAVKPQVPADADCPLRDQAEALEAQYQALNDRIDHLRRDIFILKVSSLLAIGEHFGIAARNGTGDIRQRVLHFWERANAYRKLHLDGCTTPCGSDPDGPMLAGFASALGTKPQSLVYLATADALHPRLAVLLKRCADTPVVDVDPLPDLDHLMVLAANGLVERIECGPPNKSSSATWHATRHGHARLRVVPKAYFSWGMTL